MYTIATICRSRNCFTAFNVIFDFHLAPSECLMSWTIKGIECDNMWVAEWYVGGNGSHKSHNTKRSDLPSGIP